VPFTRIVERFQIDTDGEQPMLVNIDFTEGRGYEIYGDCLPNESNPFIAVPLTAATDDDAVRAALTYLAAVWGAAATRAMRYANVFAHEGNRATGTTWECPRCDAGRAFSPNTLCEGCVAIVFPDPDATLELSQSEISAATADALTELRAAQESGVFDEPTTENMPGVAMCGDWVADLEAQYKTLHVVEPHETYEPGYDPGPKPRDVVQEAAEATSRAQRAMRKQQNGGAL